MNLFNPIKRHYLIITLFVSIGFIGVLTAVEYNYSYTSVSLMMWAAVSWGLMFWSGRCQHCGHSIPQVRFGLPKQATPDLCDKCGNSYSVPRGKK